jgi:hypothetical protein
MSNERIDEIFNEVISLYDIADELENNGEQEKSINMRITLNVIGNFIQSLKLPKDE